MREYLKQAREKAGYTQQYVANQIGISQNYYCDIENGVRQKELKTGIANKISQVLNIPFKTILSEEEKISKKLLCGDSGNEASKNSICNTA